ncbi:MAG TPA: methyltransferase domain-containing protein [Actinocrinis sp.]|nr:methyltransferase domain-containing protein [Actinocrinis sp.]
MAPGAETATYTHGHHASVLRSHTWRTARNSAAYLLPHLHAGQSVLDVGCGPGTITTDLAALVAPGRVTGLDYAAGILEQARLTAAEAGLTDRIEFVQGDVHALDFPDDAFDVVHAHQVLQHVGDPVTALREMRRVCKPGGVVAVRDSDYAGFFWYPEDPRLTSWQELYHKVARANGGEPDAGRRLWSWARAAGFGRITPSSSAWCFATDEERAWWGRSWAERVTGSDFARVAVAGGHATEAELAEAAAGWLAWAADPDASLTIPHCELLCWK